MTTDEFISNCKTAIWLAFAEIKLIRLPKDLSVVWLSKDLQNRKATFINLLEKFDERSWGVTYNGDKDEYYVDLYNGHYNVCVSGEEVQQAIKATRQHIKTECSWCTGRRIERSEQKYNVVAFKARSGYLPNLVNEATVFYGRADDGKLYYAAVDGKTKNFQWTMKQIKEYDLESYERIEVK